MSQGMGIETKCEFCKQEMDDYNPPDTREIWYRCINPKCPGPPPLLNQNELFEWLDKLVFMSDDSANFAVKVIKKEIESGKFTVNKSVVKPVL